MSSNKKTVCAAIVTYNRKELLKGLLLNLASQSHSLNGIILVNNNSNDGTEEMLRLMGVIQDGELDNLRISSWENLKIYYFHSSVNTGGSGGFAKAFKIAMNTLYEYIWVMDDDVKPDLDCLENLLKYIDTKTGICVPCRGDNSFLDVAIKKYDLRNPFFFRPGKAKRGIVPYNEIKEEYVYIEDMTFEGPLIERALIEAIGLPNKDFFIFYDDTEYAQRASRITKIKYVPSAKLHKMVIPPEKIPWSWKTYYSIRNSTYFDKQYGKNFAVRYIRPTLRMMYLFCICVVKGKYYRIPWVLRSYKHGMSGHMGKTIDPVKVNLR